MATPRVFLANPIHYTEEQLQAFKAAVALAAPDAFDHPVELVLGRDDFQQNFAAVGGWRGWPVDVAEGKRMGFDGLQPRFHAYVVPGAMVGKATAQILTRALAVGKLVASLDLETGKLARVTAIIMMDPNDNANGWALEITND
jgi:hypothetical protein